MIAEHFAIVENVKTILQTLKVERRRGGISLRTHFNNNIGCVTAYKLRKMAETAILAAACVREGK
jgi:hypothetical protein